MDNASFDRLLQTVPPYLQNKILRFRNWQDAERSLVGNVLLTKALQAMGRKETLPDLKYSEFQKPYFDESISFNISHSGLYIICAISDTNQVGVDVEEITRIVIDDFTNLFANSEWEAVLNSQDKFQAFFTLWTKKEAFLKAVGCGLSQPLNQVVIADDKINWENRDWFLHEVKLDEQHIAYICCDTISPTIDLEEIYL
jgi:4'-phosphopantetheinyl transferase